MDIFVCVVCILGGVCVDVQRRVGSPCLSDLFVSFCHFHGRGEAAAYTFNIPFKQVISHKNMGRFFFSLRAQEAMFQASAVHPLPAEVRMFRRFYEGPVRWMASVWELELFFFLVLWDFQ